MANSTIGESPPNGATATGETPGMRRCVAAVAALDHETGHRRALSLADIPLGEIEHAISAGSLTVPQRSAVTRLIADSKRERRDAAAAKRKTEQAAVQRLEADTRHRERQQIAEDWAEVNRARGGGVAVAHRATTPLEIARQVVRSFAAPPDGGYMRIVRERVKGERHTVLFVDRETGIWSETASIASIYLQAAIRALVDFARKEWDTDDIADLGKRMTTIEGPSFERSVISMLPTAAAEAGISTIEWDAFNRPRRYIGTPAGVLSLETMTVLPPDDGARHLITRCSAAEYDPDAVHPVVDSLTAHLPPTVAAFFWEAIGFALLGRAMRRFYLIVGSKQSGKTFAADCLRVALGDYASEIPRGSMARPRRASDTATSAALAESGSAFLDGVRLAIEDEPNPGALDTARLKKVSGGGALQWRPLFGHWRIGLLTATPIFFSNDMESIPRLGLDDPALVDRFAAIPFPPLTAAQRSAHPNIEQVKGDDRFRAALFARCVRAASEACRLCDDEGDRPPALIPEVAAEIRAARQAEAGDMGLLAVRIVEAPGAFLPFESLWKAWAEINEQPDSESRIGDLTKRAFRPAVQRWAKALAAAPYEQRRAIVGDRPKRGWVGFALADPDDIGPDETGPEASAPAPALTAPSPPRGRRCDSDGCDAVALDSDTDDHGRRVYFCAAHPPPTPF